MNPNTTLSVMSLMLSSIRRPKRVTARSKRDQTGSSASAFLRAVLSRAAATTFSRARRSRSAAARSFSRSLATRSRSMAAARSRARRAFSCASSHSFRRLAGSLRQEALSLRHLLRHPGERRHPGRPCRPDRHRRLAAPPILSSFERNEGSLHPSGTHHFVPPVPERNKDLERFFSPESLPEVAALVEDLDLEIISIIPPLEP